MAIGGDDFENSEIDDETFLRLIEELVTEGKSQQEITKEVQTQITKEGVRGADVFKESTFSDFSVKSPEEILNPPTGKED